MPGPPPPPPPAGGPPVCPPPPTFNLGSTKGDSRGALLNSIRKGTTLKKTVTNDRSAPAVAGNPPRNNNSVSNNSSSTSVPMTNGVGLGGLFAGGMPKLKPVTKQMAGINISSNANAESYSQSKSSGKNYSQTNVQKNISVMQNEVQSALKKQMASNSNRNRGPPPPAPTRNISQSTEHLQDSVKQSYYSRNGSTNGLHLSISTLHRPTSSPQQSPTSPSPNFSTLHANSSTLHRKASSSANLSSTGYDVTDVSNGLSTQSMRKPHLAPKPPVLNGKPAAPPKKLIMNGRPSSLHRAQSMKSPRTPSPQSPEEYNYPSKFGTVRNISSVLDKSLGHKMRPSINSRPTAPPPLVPFQHNHTYAASKVNTVKPPSHAPPPPPNVPPSLPNAPPQPPAHAPPPPPQRGSYQTPVRSSPAIPPNSNAPPPPPPPRHSSMRDLNGSRMSLDIDYQFRNEFHSVSEFSPPGPYRGIAKFYSNQESAC